MFQNNPASLDLVMLLKTVTIKQFSKDLAMKLKKNDDSQIIEFEANFSYGGNNLGSASAFYRKEEKTFEISGFYPFHNASQLQGKNFAILFYFKLLNKCVKYLPSDLDKLLVIPNRVNSSEYVAFLSRIGLDGKNRFPFSVLLESTAKANQLRAKDLTFVLN